MILGCKSTHLGSIPLFENMSLCLVKTLADGKEVPENTLVKCLNAFDILVNKYNNRQHKCQNQTGTGYHCLEDNNIWVSIT